ncbi:MAG: adenine phosphoribosyltransferase [Candidatus Aenigmarchaeota archaeon]|nr:adenine phosphoribosyltransferase [Candidatus Aenigmarchaeota archaeon]
MDIKSKIRRVPDFPKRGVVYRDITTLLQDPQAFRHVIKRMVDHYSDKGIDKIVAAESRGFIFGSVLAHELGKPFILLRKPGKLPWKTVRHEYTTEYSTDALEMHEDAIGKGDKILLLDDLLATGGTMEASVRMIEKQGGKVAGIGFIIELSFLNGRKRLEGYDVFSLVDYRSGDE